MTKNNAIVAVFTDHQTAEAAVRKLAEGGLDIQHFSIVGKGYHSEEKVVGFYNADDRIMFWGKMVRCGAASGASSSVAS